MTTPEDLQAKIGFIRAFFEDLESKAAFTDELEQQGRDDEARILCCIYIESVGNGLFHPSGAYASNFARALIEHGQVELFAVTVPAWLLKDLPWGSASPSVRAEVQKHLSALPSTEGALAADFLNAARTALSSTAFEFLKRELWRGTVAAATYQSMRTPGAHWFGSPSGISFSLTSWRGTQLPGVTFSDLRRALNSLIGYAKGISISSALWFGNSAVA